MSLADSAGAMWALLSLPAGGATSTIESKTNCFRAVREGHVEAVARPLHVGRSTIVVQTDVRDGSGRRAAQATQTHAVLPPDERTATWRAPRPPNPRPHPAPARLAPPRHPLHPLALAPPPRPHPPPTPPPHPP